jgi:hypothetical protein
LLQKGYAGPIHPNQYRLMEAGNYLQENSREVTINGVPLSEFRGNDLHGAPDLSHEQQQEITPEPSAPQAPLPIAEAVQVETAVPVDGVEPVDAVATAEVEPVEAVPLAEVVQVEQPMQYDLSPKPTPSAAKKADKDQEETYTQAPKAVNENGQSVVSTLPSSPAVAQSREKFGVDPTKPVQVKADPSPANTASSPFATPTLSPNISD